MQHLQILDAHTYLERGGVKEHPIGLENLKMNQHFLSLKRSDGGCSRIGHVIQVGGLLEGVLLSGGTYVCGLGV